MARAAGVIGEKWTLLILRSAFYGISRFGDFSEELGIARNILSNRLRWLVAHGVMERQLYQESPARYEYLLTAKGRALFPVLATIKHWADEWTEANGDDPEALVHHRCGGHDVHAVTSCSDCGAAIDPGEIRVEPPPAPVQARIAESLERWRHELADSA